MTGVALVIQARAGSTRLPGKVLLPLGGRRVLEWVIRAAGQVEGIDEIVVATTTESVDDEVVALANQMGARTFRGATDDVLGRFLGSIDLSHVDAVVRVTADCPLLDPQLVSLVVAAWRAAPDIDHISTLSPRSLPRGLDVEVAAVCALRRASQQLVSPDLLHHRTHVTSYLYQRPDLFRVAGISMHPASHDLRVTLDTVDDLRLLEHLVRELGDGPPRWRDVVCVLREKPGLVALNAHVQQKRLEEG